MADPQSCNEAGPSSRLVDGFGHPVSVFTRESEMQQEAASASARAEGQDVDYEFNERDFHVVMAGYSLLSARSSRPLMTRQMREEEEKRKIASYGPVPIRFEFPDGYIIQALFPVTAPLEELHSLVAAALRPDLAQGFHLFTVPPKTILKDLETETMYSAKLVPAARVHVGFNTDVDWNKGLSAEEERSSKSEKTAGDEQQQQKAVASVLNEQALALCSAPPPKAAALKEGRAAVPQEESKEDTAPVKKAPGGNKKPGRGVPKWLKIGK